MLGISWGDIWLQLGAAVAVAAVCAVCARPFLLLSFDREQARVGGLLGRALRVADARHGRADRGGLVPDRRHAAGVRDADRAPGDRRARRAPDRGDDGRRRGARGALGGRRPAALVPLRPGGGRVDRAGGGGGLLRRAHGAVPAPPGRPAGAGVSAPAVALRRARGRATAAGRWWRGSSLEVARGGHARRARHERLGEVDAGEDDRRPAAAGGRVACGCSGGARRRARPGRLPRPGRSRRGFVLPLRAVDVVAMGRFAARGLLGRMSRRRPPARAREGMARMGVADLAERGARATCRAASASACTSRGAGLARRPADAGRADGRPRPGRAGAAGARAWPRSGAAGRRWSMCTHDVSDALGGRARRCCWPEAGGRERPARRGADARGRDGDVRPGARGAARRAASWSWTPSTATTTRTATCTTSRTGQARDGVRGRRHTGPMLLSPLTRTIAIVARRRTRRALGVDAVAGMGRDRAHHAGRRGRVRARPAPPALGSPGDAGDPPHRTDPGARWAGHALDRVARAGHRSGGARRAVIESLAAQDCCRSAQEIFDQLRDDGRAVGIASVYRVLDLLVSLGLVQRLDLGGGTARYEPAMPGGEHHHHAVCTDCGEVLPFEDAALERALEAAAGRAELEVDGHDVVLWGRCAACRAG